MNMKTKRIFLIVMAVLALLLCVVPASAQDIKYNFLPGTDFAKYKTYKWARIPKVEYPNQILDNQIMQAIDAQLLLKGLSKTDGESADLIVVYQAAVSQQQRWNSYSTDMGGGGWGYGRWGGWGGYGGGTSTTTTTSETINIGTLNVDLYDAAAKNQIWRGAATKTLGPAKIQKRSTRTSTRPWRNFSRNIHPPVKK
jgi:hypothetical protein